MDWIKKCCGGKSAQADNQPQQPAQQAPAETKPEEVNANTPQQ